MASQSDVRGRSRERGAKDAKDRGAKVAADRDKERAGKVAADRDKDKERAVKGKADKDKERERGGKGRDKEKDKVGGWPPPARSTWLSAALAAHLGPADLGVLCACAAQPHALTLPPASAPAGLQACRSQRGARGALPPQQPAGAGEGGQGVPQQARQGAAVAQPRPRRLWRARAAAAARGGRAQGRPLAAHGRRGTRGARARGSGTLPQAGASVGACAAGRSRVR